ncbi:MAG: serine/threonine-protein kinase RsbW [Solirubrobacteraceae bacterium]|jgi:anti-sigma regulatory factor (Ser/Thr protein kinase)|nr:serine/threonine-protein kinase RsbW [Solirubrobacteraceae bacterium]
MSTSVTFDIPRDPTAPRHARRAIEAIADQIGPAVVPDVKLLVSELITNSVKYGADGHVTLKVDTHHTHRLRVEVVDQGAGFVPVARNRPATDVGGWGLHLVQTLSDRWGVYEGSTHVWFEIDRAGDRAVAAAA